MEDIAERTWDAVERARAEVALRAERAVFESFYNGVPFMMGIAELDGDRAVAVSGNQKVSEFFGRTTNDLIGRSGPELGTPEEIERLWVEHYRRSQREGQIITFEYRDPRLAEIPWFRVTVSFLAQGPTGRPRFSFVAEDITERKRIEEALRESEERFRTL